MARPFLSKSSDIGLVIRLHVVPRRRCRLLASARCTMGVRSANATVWRHGLSSYWIISCRLYAAVAIRLLYCNSEPRHAIIWRTYNFHKSLRTYGCNSSVYETRRIGSSRPVGMNKALWSYQRMSLGLAGERPWLSTKLCCSCHFNHLLNDISFARMLKRALSMHAHPILELRPQPRDNNHVTSFLKQVQ